MQFQMAGINTSWQLTWTHFPMSMSLHQVKDATLSVGDISIYENATFPFIEMLHVEMHWCKKWSAYKVWKTRGH